MRMKRVYACEGSLNKNVPYPYADFQGDIWIDNGHYLSERRITRRCLWPRRNATKEETEHYYVLKKMMNL